MFCCCVDVTVNSFASAVGRPYSLMTAAYMLTAQNNAPLHILDKACWITHAGMEKHWWALYLLNLCTLAELPLLVRAVTECACAHSYIKQYCRVEGRH